MMATSCLAIKQTALKFQHHSVTQSLLAVIQSEQQKFLHSPGSLIQIQLKLHYLGDCVSVLNNHDFDDGKLQKQLQMGSRKLQQAAMFLAPQHGGTESKFLGDPLVECNIAEWDKIQVVGLTQIKKKKSMKHLHSNKNVQFSIVRVSNKIHLIITKK